MSAGPVARSAPPAPYQWLALGCGFVWGLLALLIAYPLLQSASLGGLLLSPAIGWLVGRCGWPWRQAAGLWRALWALLGLYLAALLFGLACGATDLLLHRGTGRDALEVLFENLATFVLGMTLSGWAVLFWPLSWAAQMFLWRVGGRAA